VNYVFHDSSKSRPVLNVRYQIDRHSKPRPASYRVLPPGEFNGMIPEPAVTVLP